MIREVCMSVVLREVYVFWSASENKLAFTLAKTLPKNHDSWAFDRILVYPNEIPRWFGSIRDTEVLERILEHDPYIMEGDNVAAYFKEMLRGK
jgi:hypothetical protein